MNTNIREPKQKRAIAKKEHIIDAGFELICKNGYYNTNTVEIAKKAHVSTGIVYQYFNDKHDILIASIKKYGADIFFPMLKIKEENISIHNFEEVIKEMITNYINNHQVSEIAHEEIMSMVHSDHEIAEYYYNLELEMTKNIKNILVKNNFQDNNLLEKVHIMIGMIDNLCHEVIYHKHQCMDYDIMLNIVTKNILYLFQDSLH